MFKHTMDILHRIFSPRASRSISLKVVLVVVVVLVLVVTNYKNLRFKKALRRKDGAFKY